MAALVVDASVCIKWYVEEQLSEVAEALLADDEELHAPELVLIEIANIAWKKAMRGEIADRHAMEIVDDSRNAPMELTPAKELCDRAIEMALTIRHPVYDCFYLACTERIGGVMVTADERFVRAVAPTPFGPLVKSLHSVA